MTVKLLLTLAIPILVLLRVGMHGFGHLHLQLNPIVLTLPTVRAITKVDNMASGVIRLPSMTNARANGVLMGCSMGRVCFAILGKAEWLTATLHSIY